MEEKAINHFCDEHPLILTENVGTEETICSGCHMPVILESAYVCSQQYYCLRKTILHQKCAELPTQILHPSHPEHLLHLFDYPSGWGYCSLCGYDMEGMLGYRCPICNFDIEISCQKLDCIDLLEKKRLQHPSHCHSLTLMRKPAFLFRCDGCGTEDSDMAYACSTCEFWVHKTCALLPISLPTNHHHHHLSLAFFFPIQYRKLWYNCDICNKALHMTCWVYYCGDCRYFSHVKCATSSSKVTDKESSSNTEENDDSGLIQFPLNDVSKELITPFIIGENGADKISADIREMPASVVMPGTTASNFSLLFNYHKHPLSLVLEKEADNDQLMICDVCVTPIYSPPYYKCATATCKYFLHSTCYFLPKTLSLDSELYSRPTCQNHKLTTYTSRSEWDRDGYFYCGLCFCYTNGMVYECEHCEMRIDVKCASLPTTIKHAFHHQHKLIITRRISWEDQEKRPCYVCGSAFEVGYCCTNDDCGFALDVKCVQLRPSITHESDKHPLLLTYDASIDHPTDFYCDNCEEEMHPKLWMYHCRECDRSFHTGCLKAESGEYRNMKFGRQVEFDHHLHPHPLTYKSITLKLTCDICHRYWYQLFGFECESCNFVMCIFCGQDHFQ